MVINYWTKMRLWVVAAVGQSLSVLPWLAGRRCVDRQVYENCLGDDDDQALGLNDPPTFQKTVNGRGAKNDVAGLQLIDTFITLLRGFLEQTQREGLISQLIIYSRRAPPGKGDALFWSSLAVSASFMDRLSREVVIVKRNRRAADSTNYVVVNIPPSLNCSQFEASKLVYSQGE